MRIVCSAAVKIALPFVGFVLVMAPVTAQDHSGVWKLDAAKSTYSERAERSKSGTLRVEVDETGVKFNARSVTAGGAEFQVTYHARFDGKDYPVTGLPDADTVSVSRLDAKTFESTLKKNGRPVVTVIWRVSKDGKTQTLTFRGKDLEGHDVNDVLVYDRMDIACGPRFCEKRCKGKCGNGSSCDCPKK